MDVPPEIRIKVGIHLGAIYHFSHDSFQTATPHFFVVLNHSPKSGANIVLVVATSKVDKVKRIYRRMPTSTLVEVLPGECPIFSKPTIFNCNHVFEEPIQVLIDKLKAGELLVKQTIPNSILQKVVNGVHSSPQVPSKIKKMLPPRT